MDILDKTIMINQDLKRNIVAIKNEVNYFDDLLDDSSLAEQSAQKVISIARDDICIDGGLSDFYYTCAIEYPFVTEPYLQSRFSDGSYPVWYGSFDIKTSVLETAYHTVNHILAIDGIGDEEYIFRNRAVYNVHCRALLIDIAGKENNFSELVDDDYNFAQSIGKDVQSNGYPGIRSTSVRNPGGKNANIFRENVLSSPRVDDFLLYRYSPSSRELSVTFDSGENGIVLKY